MNSLRWAYGRIMRRDQLPSSSVSTSGRLYGTQPFNPWQILFQLAILQICFYVLFSLELLFVLLMFKHPVKLGIIFDGSYYSYSGVNWKYGRLFLILFVPMSILMAYFLKFVVKRAKKCSDFVFSYFFFHLILCWTIKGFPLYWGFWTSCLLAGVCTTLLAERLCSRRELEEIRLQHYRAHEMDSISSSSSDSSLIDDKVDLKYAV